MARLRIQAYGAVPSLAESWVGQAGLGSVAVGQVQAWLSRHPELAAEFIKDGNQDDVSLSADDDETRKADD